MKRRRIVGSIVPGLLVLAVFAVARADSPPEEDNEVQAQKPEMVVIPNSLIDPQKFLASANKAIELRESRRLTEEEFIRQSREKGVIVLDARSKDRYEQLHIHGAMSLPYTDFSFDSLAERLPDKSAKILIYCNNNFRGNVAEFPMKSAGVALNLNTFTSLYEYGYRNVYELGPEVDLQETKLELVGTNADSYRAISQLLKNSQ
jgi:rhodanese-related sulfurtransferase